MTVQVAVLAPRVFSVAVPSQAYRSGVLPSENIMLLVLHPE